MSTDREILRLAIPLAAGRMGREHVGAGVTHMLSACAQAGDCSAVHDVGDVSDGLDRAPGADAASFRWVVSQAINSGEQFGLTAPKWEEHDRMTLFDGDTAVYSMPDDVDIDIFVVALRYVRDRYEWVVDELSAGGASWIECGRFENGWVSGGHESMRPDQLRAAARHGLGE